MARKADRFGTPDTRERLPSLVAVAGALAIAVLVSRAIWFGDPIADSDEQLYSLIGQQMLAGHVPFVDLWDRKPVGLFAIFAVAHGIFGPGVIAYQLVACGFTFAGSWLVYRLARALTDRFGACCAGMLYAMLMAVYGSHSGQSETFFMPLMLAALWLVRDPDHPHALRRAACAMLLGGAALQIKYTVLPQCLLLGGWALLGQWRRGTGLARLAGIALLFAALGIAATLLVVACYASIGQLGALIEANVTSAFARGAAPLGRWTPGAALIVNPAVVLAFAGLYWSLRVDPPAERRIYALYAAWFAACLASVFLPATVYLYYLATIVPGAILLAAPLLGARGRLGVVPGLALLGIALALLHLPERYRLARQDIAAVDQLSRAIAPHLSPGQCLWVHDGPAALYRLTGSCLPTRYIYPDHLDNLLEHDALGVSQPGEVARILSHRPGVVVVADQPVTQQSPDVMALVRRTLADDYMPLGSVMIRDRRVSAYRWRGAGG